MLPGTGGWNPGRVQRDLAEGLAVTWVGTSTTTAEVGKSLARFDPEVLVLSGWNNPLYRSQVCDSRFSRAIRILAIDNQRKPGFRQAGGRLLLRRLLRRFHGVMVPGERSWQFARYLGFDEAQIIRGTYGIDFTSFHRTARGERSGFLFVGRYLELKGVDLLLEAYRRYRSKVDDPWELAFCGKGPLGILLEREPASPISGSCKPSELPEVMASTAVFVLPSRVEPWAK